jgi:EmrB/QacA subfamily drug resistance transporter
MQQSSEGAPTASVKRWILAAAILGSSIAFIDGSVVGVALPAIQSDLNATVADMQWTTNAYMLMLGALILVGGSAGDHYGRRLIFVVGIILFTAASVWCGLAPDATQLVLARGVQGIGGALMVPASLAIIGAAFPRNERGAAIGTWAGFSALTTALGPLLGGWMIDTFSWRPIFFLNVPLAVITVAITLWHVPESHDRTAGRSLDWGGAALATGGLGGIIYALIEAPERSWSDPTVVIPLAAGVALLILFVLLESRLRHPMMPLDIFRSSTFSGANLLTLFVYAALSGGLFFLPFNLIQVQGYKATEAGAVFLPFTLMMGILSRWSGKLIDRYGARKPLIVGPLITAIGYALFALPGIGGSYWTTIFPPMVMLGLGMTITVAPLTTAVLSTVSEDQAGVASGINNAVSRIAGALAVAVLGIVAIASFSSALDERLSAASIPAEARTAMLAQEHRLADATPPQNLDAATRQSIKQAVDLSFVHSYRIIMLLSAAITLGGSIVAWLMIEPERHRKQGAHKQE